MAVSAAKAKTAPKANNATPKVKTQLHRRSRTGCYTCRLRRKKCDEGSPMCSACKHLGLVCEYKRPIWWSNNDARKKHKDEIKTIIKRKKLSEKTSQSIQTSVGSPPALSHSLPTSATFSEGLDRTRSGSIDSHFSSAFNFNSPPTEYGVFNGGFHPEFAGFGTFSPYEIDVKTERQMFVNDVPTIKESTVSTFSTYQPPPPPGSILPSTEWSSSETTTLFEERRESLAEETLNPNFFDLGHGPPATTRQVAIELDEDDQRLLDHFIQHVIPTIFPILESNQHGSVGSDLILPALQNNKAYLQICLGIAGQHLKSTSASPAAELDASILQHRYAAIAELSSALSRLENLTEILEATLGQITLQSAVGKVEDSLPDIPWHQHFQAALNVVSRLDLLRIACEAGPEASQQTPFNVTLTTWIDIFGATVLGRSPIFAHNYREKLLSASPSLGLRELMGCDDRVMYLISEIACLEALKRDGMDDITLCQHVHGLGGQITLTEQDEPAPRAPYNANGTLSPKQLSRNMTAAFRIAARIYLCSLVPGFNPGQDSCKGLVEKLMQVLQHIPAGPHGFDRSLLWVYVMAGSVSLPGSSFRAFFEDRAAQLADHAAFGNFARVAALLRETWLQADSLAAVVSPVSDTGDVPFVHWRDVMMEKGWDFLFM